MSGSSIKLSIIIPVYNGSDTLHACVASVLKEKPVWNYEIILVNDGSTDSTEIVCRQLQGRWGERIRYVCKENGGSLSARLRGAREAQGEFLLYMDCDDELLPDTLNRALACISDPACDVYLLDYLYEHPQTGELRTQKAIPHCQVPTVFRGHNRKCVMDAFMAETLNTMCCCLIRRSVMDNVFFLEKERKMTVGEDRLQKMFVLIHSREIAYIPLAIYWYLPRPDSQSAPLYAQRISNPDMLLRDFDTCWRYEKLQEDALLQTPEEKLGADRKRLRRISTLLKDVLVDPGYSTGEKKALFRLACSLESVVSAASHVRQSRKNGFYISCIAGILKSGSYWQFMLFVKLLSLYRQLKYGSR